MGILIGFALQGFSSSSWTHLVFSVVFVLFIVAGFDKSRSRDTWAKVAFTIVGALGITYAVMRYLVDFQKINLAGSEGLVILLSTARGLTLGLMLGLILALALSGQLLGESRGADSATVATRLRPNDLHF